MSDVQFLNVARGALLGSGAGTYYRVVLERNSKTGGLVNAVWLDTVRRVHEKLAQSRVAFSVSKPSATGADQTAVYDLRVTAEGSSHTVADLVNAVESSVDVVGRNAARVRSVERVTKVSAADREEVQRKTTDDVRDERAAAPLGQVLAGVQSLGKVAYWLVVVLLVGGAVFLGFKAYAAAKVAGKVVGV